MTPPDVPPPWVHAPALLTDEQRREVLHAVAGLHDAESAASSRRRELWEAALLANTQPTGGHPLDQPGGHGVAVPIALDTVSACAAVRSWMRDAARRLGIDVDWSAGARLGREHEAVVMRYRAGEWLEEHIDTANEARATVIKLSGVVRLSGPQTVRWGYMPPCDLAPGDAVAWPAWRRHFVAPGPQQRYSLSLSAFGPPWR